MLRDEYNSFITITDDTTHTKEGLPLSGMRVAVKDNICTKDILTTAGSNMLKNFVPPYDATVVERLIFAGANIVGKTNMDEFAMGSTTESSCFGVVYNPHDRSRVAGGSSGGSAAAVAAGLCDAALGSDTGGSIRQPCAYCGVTGIKPTYGVVSRYGLIAYASSFDQIGPIAADVKTCARVLEVISGYDDRDATSVKNEAYSYINTLDELDKYIDKTAKSGLLRGVKIAIPKQYLEEIKDEKIKEAVLEAKEFFIRLGAEVADVNISNTEYAVPAYYVIACAQASSNLARFDGVKYGYRASDYNDLSDMYEQTGFEGFGDEVRRRIKLGEYVLSKGFYDEYYIKALKIRALIAREYFEIFKDYDMILSPVTPTVAPRIGTYKNDRIKQYDSDIFTVAANLCSIPAVSFPCGYKEIEQKDKKIKLPIGAQLMGNLFSEEALIKTVHIYQRLNKDN